MSTPKSTENLWQDLKTFAHSCSLSSLSEFVLIGEEKWPNLKASGLCVLTWNKHIQKGILLEMEQKVLASTIPSVFQVLL